MAKNERMIEIKGLNRSLARLRAAGAGLEREALTRAVVRVTRMAAGVLQRDYAAATARDTGLLADSVQGVYDVSLDRMTGFVTVGAKPHYLNPVDHRDRTSERVQEGVVREIERRAVRVLKQEVDHVGRKELGHDYRSNI